MLASKLSKKVGKEKEASDDEEEIEIPLHGLSSDDDDSSDEDEPEQEPVDVEKLPTIAKDDANVKRRLEKAKRSPVRPLFLHLRLDSVFFAVGRPRCIIPG